MTRAWQLQFKGSVANASSLPMHAVTIQSVVAGSAVVNCSVEFPSNQTAHSFRQLVAEDMFSAEFLEQVRMFGQCLALTLEILENIQSLTVRALICLNMHFFDCLYWQSLQT